MRYPRLANLALVAGLALTSSAPVAAGSSDAAGNAPALVEMTDDGPVFVTPAGMTLYTFAPDDSTPGKSQCTSVPIRTMKDPTAGLGNFPLPGSQFIRSCIDRWPAFMADANASPGGDWSLIDRPEGKQWAYRGHPLYMSVKDHRAGERNGLFNSQFAQRGWKLAAPPLNLPPGLKLSRNGESLVLAATNGRPVYTPVGGKRLFEARAGGVDLFQPVSAPFVAKLGGDWSIIEAGAGRLQYAYKGKPLYVAPDSLSDSEIDQAGGWDRVVYRKLAGRPAEIETRFSLMGEVYADKSGHTLYVYTCTSTGCDDPGGPAALWAALCGEAQECARRWRPYRASSGAKPVGEWSVVDVADPNFTDPAGPTYPRDAPRVKAWAYRGRPVYTYYEDKEPGDVWGNQLRWFAMAAFAALQVPGRGIYD